MTASLLPASGYHPDAYFTPPELVCVLLEHETFDGPVWEPACGDGAVSGVFTALGHEVVSTDTHDYGYPARLRAMDFLADDPDFAFSNIVTNPPYRGGLRRWVERCCSHAPKKVALLLPWPTVIDLTDPCRTAGLRASRVIQFTRRKTRFVRADGVGFTPNWEACWLVFERGFRGNDSLIRCD